MNPVTLSYSELRDLYRSKSLRPSEVIEGYLKNIETKNKDLNALLETQEDKVRDRVKSLESKISDIDRLPLYGAPIVIKDNFLVKGWGATAGSKILENYRSPYTATSVARLEEAGAIVIGKANCDEFAMGSSNENSAYGPVRNPWDRERVPGGSSGGSAAAVAGGLGLMALGTDTGGSIRQPASLCGIVGMKPSYGRVSRYGVIAYASSLDQVGPFARTVWDTARVLEVMSGFDPYDATSSQSKVPTYTDQLKGASLKGITFGVPRSWLVGCDPEVEKIFNDSLKQIQNMGGQIVEVEMPYVKYALATYYLIAPSECSSNLARYDGVHYGHRTKNAKDSDSLYMNSRGEGFGKEVKLRIMLGTYALSSGYYDAYYMKANQVRRLIQNDFENVFKKCQAMIVPTSPTTAFKLGDKSDDPIKMYLSDVCTLPVNLAGLPGISIPAGLDSSRLPVGIQMIGKRFEELNLLKMAAAYEEARGKFPVCH